jgi:hypothetical protein
MDTWKDEIQSHTKGFHVVVHDNKCYDGIIGRNTIVVSTMSRMRVNPINNKWLLMIIDECLTVQNKNALWTEEAWKQSLMSKHLVMMSATFFRTRFDKLYYMLEMLQTGLPTRREYLDTILVDSIVSNIALTKRKWTSNVNRFTLSDSAMKEYTKIENIDLSAETVYGKLQSWLIKYGDITSDLDKLVKSLDKKNHRCLIYARSKGEAIGWSTIMKIPIYPVKGKHCIVTYNDGTYGLNDLVVYDTIVMRPPPPDKLPQIKGRLDRPGNKHDNLRIEYFLIENTIEEGLLLRMEIASQFAYNYIMPLVRFYDLSVNFREYQ